MASFEEQSTNLPGNEDISKALFLLVNSLAFLAATRALEATTDFSIIIFASSGFSSKNRSKPSEKIESLIFLTSLLPNLVLVCPSTCGLRCFKDMIAVNPSLTSSPVKGSSVDFK